MKARSKTFVFAFKHSDPKLRPHGPPTMWTCSFQHGEIFVSNDEKLSRDEVRRRIGLVSTHNQHSGPRPLHTWESPDWSILDDRRGELPDFPLDCLGEPLKQWVERAAAG